MSDPTSDNSNMVQPSLRGAVAMMPMDKPMDFFIMKDESQGGWQSPEVAFGGGDGGAGQDGGVDGLNPEGATLPFLTDRHEDGKDNAAPFDVAATHVAAPVEGTTAAATNATTAADTSVRCHAAVETTGEELSDAREHIECQILPGEISSTRPEEASSSPTLRTHLLVALDVTQGSPAAPLVTARDVDSESNEAAYTPPVERRGASTRVHFATTPDNIVRSTGTDATSADMSTSVTLSMWVQRTAVSMPSGLRGWRSMRNRLPVDPTRSRPLRSASCSVSRVSVSPQVTHLPTIRGALSKDEGHVTNLEGCHMGKQTRDSSARMPFSRGKHGVGGNEDAGLNQAGSPHSRRRHSMTDEDHTSGGDIDLLSMEPRGFGRALLMTGLATSSPAGAAATTASKEAITAKVHEARSYRERGGGGLGFAVAPQGRLALTDQDLGGGGRSFIPETSPPRLHQPNRGVGVRQGANRMFNAALFVAALKREAPTSNAIQRTVLGVVLDRTPPLAVPSPLKVPVAARESGAAGAMPGVGLGSGNFEHSLPCLAPMGKRFRRLSGKL